MHGRYANRCGYAQRQRYFALFRSSQETRNVLKALRAAHTNRSSKAETIRRAAITRTVGMSLPSLRETVVLTACTMSRILAIRVVKLCRIVSPPLTSLASVFLFVSTSVQHFILMQYYMSEKQKIIKKNRELIRHF